MLKEHFIAQECVEWRNSSDRNYQLIILQLSMDYTLQARNQSRNGKMIDGDVQI